MVLAYRLPPTTLARLRLLNEGNSTAPNGTLMPNPSLKLTRYGRHCKPGLRYSVHCLSPGLQYLPPRGISERTKPTCPLG